MADFDITVDTRPMADSLDSVNSSVRGVTTSVVAMQSAVVLAQEEASANICRNVDKGFFVLLKSQFDQKIAGVSSKMLSTMQLMETFKGDIDKIMAVMQDDYERIKLRYMKHFSALDKALETRVHELDKRAYDISKNYKMSQFKTGSEVLKALCYGDDTQLVNVKEVSATVKNKSVKAIGVMSGDVIEQLKYSASVQSILKDAPSDKVQDEFVPVIFTEVDSIVSRDVSVRNIVTSSDADFSVSSKYLNQLKENSENLTWKEIGSEDFEPVEEKAAAPDTPPAKTEAAKDPAADGDALEGMDF